MDSEVQPRLSVESQRGEKRTKAEDEKTPCSLRHEALTEGSVPKAAVKKLIFKAESHCAPLRTLTSPWIEPSLALGVEVHLENDQPFSRHNALQQKFTNWVQCSLCDNWRKLPNGAVIPNGDLEWTCDENPDASRNHCGVPEEQECDLECGPVSSSDEESEKEEDATEADEEEEEGVFHSESDSYEEKKARPKKRKRKKKEDKSLETLPDPSQEEHAEGSGHAEESDTAPDFERGPVSSLKKIENWSNKDNQILWDAKKAGKTVREIYKLIPSRSLKAIKTRLEAGRGKPGSTWGLSTRVWNADEELLLTEHVNTFGPTQWKQAEDRLPGRTSGGCREHWKSMNGGVMGALKTIKNSQWNAIDDNLLTNAVKEHGTAWAKITLLFPGRSIQAPKNRWFQLNTPKTNGGSTPWSAAEDDELMIAYKTQGNAWTKLAPKFPGRSARQMARRVSFLMNDKNQTLSVHGQPRKRARNGGARKPSQFEQEAREKSYSNFEALIDELPTQHPFMAVRAAMPWNKGVKPPPVEVHAKEQPSESDEAKYPPLETTLRTNHRLAVSRYKLGQTIASAAKYVSGFGLIR